MQLAQVIGTATATVKHKSLVGSKMLLVQPVMNDGEADGFPLLAVDTVGSGIGQQVFITSDGKFSREWLGHENTPVRWTIIGIKD